MRNLTEIANFLGFSIGKSYIINGIPHVFMLNMFGEPGFMSKRGEGKALVDMSLYEILLIKEEK